MKRVICIAAMFMIGACDATNEGAVDAGAPDATCANAFDLCMGMCGHPGEFCCWADGGPASFCLGQATCKSDICTEQASAIAAPASAGEYEGAATILPTAICEGYLPWVTHLTLKNNGTATVTDGDNRVYQSTWTAEPNGFVLGALPGQLDYLGENWNAPVATHFAQTMPGRYEATVEWRDATRASVRCFFPTAFIKL